MNREEGPGWCLGLSHSVEMQLFTEVGTDSWGRQGHGRPRTEISSRWLDRCVWSMVRSGNQRPVGIVQSTQVLKRPSPDPPSRVLWQWGMGSAPVLPAFTSRHIFHAGSSLPVDTPHGSFLMGLDLDFSILFLTFLSLAFHPSSCS